MSVRLLREIADLAREELLGALEGVDQAHAWAVMPAAGEDYLHSDGSIHGIILHIATGEMMYGSTAFRNTEVRWRDLAERVSAFEPDWEAARAFLDESHAYWLSTWANLSDSDLDAEVPHFSGKLWPAWKIIRMMIHHDSYHAGQIAVLRYGLGPTDTPPPSAAEDIRTHCVALPGW